jgi:hypothetical protein
MKKESLGLKGQLPDKITSKLETFTFTNLQHFNSVMQRLVPLIMV